ncbi:MAG: 2OG-Fe(II) oxygenase, partial [Rhodospirillaceae bacterium]
MTPPPDQNPHRDDWAMAESAISKVIRSGLPALAEQQALNALATGAETQALWLKAAQAQRLQGKWPQAAASYHQAAEMGPNGALWQSCSAVLSGAPGDDPLPLDLPITPFLWAEQIISPDLDQQLRDHQTERKAHEAITFGKTRKRLRQAQAWRVTRELLRAALKDSAALTQRANSLLCADAMDPEAVEATLLDYGDQGGYLQHRDSKPEDGAFGDRQRLLTMVHYLQIDSEAFSGGDLVLHDPDGKGQTLIRPRSGLTVAFPASALHEVT